MINFKINPDAIQIATKRVNENNRKKANLQVCLNGLVCPICAKDLEKHIDGGRNIKHVCTSDSCNFVWPSDVPEKVKAYKPKRPSCKDVHGPYSGEGIGARTTFKAGGKLLCRTVEQVLKEMSKKKT